MCEYGPFRFHLRKVRPINEIYINYNCVCFQWVGKLGHGQTIMEILWDTEIYMEDIVQLHLAETVCNDMDWVKLNLDSTRSVTRNVKTSVTGN
jgi:hypothetical protein